MRERERCKAETAFSLHPASRETSSIHPSERWIRNQIRSERNERERNREREREREIERERDHLIYFAKRQRGIR